MLFWLRQVFGAVCRLSPRCGEWGLLWLLRLLTAVAFLVAEHGLQTTGFGGCGAQSMRDLPSPGTEPRPPALTGGFQPLDHQGSP